jgi:dihydroorotase
MIAIRNGEVLMANGWARADLLIADGRIAAMGVVPSAPTEIDATGCLVGPGFVDLHTHLREPGQTWKEDIASGSRAAAAGGYTAVTAMPNTDPPTDTAKVVQEVLDKARENAVIEVIPSSAISVGRAGAVPVDFAEIYRMGVRLFTDDGDSVGDADVLAAAMREIVRLPGAFIAQHAEDRTRTADRHMHEGEISRRLGVGGLPAEAESDVVRRDLALVAETGARYHCQHVSAKMTVELIRRAKQSGLPVTAEVTPHHLTFDESALADLDPDFKMYPPLRSAVDRSALVDALQEGVIDVVATDHAPHLPAEKQVDFSAAPRGVIGLETAASATWEALGDRDRLFSVLAAEPARILGLDHQGGPLRPGGPANLVVFDPDARWLPGIFQSRSSNSPYRGREMTGRVRATVCKGELAHREVST